MEKTTPVIIVDQYRKSAHIKSTNNSYKGLQIHALPGLHDIIGALSERYLTTPGTILDLAAGSGAMALRLSDLGFKVTATDYVVENFRPREIEFKAADLNTEFSKYFTNNFDSIIASEIIEHLENPRNFIRECSNLLKPGGRILLTTPNIESHSSLMTFIQSGNFSWFTDEDYSTQGHITPLSQWQLNKIFSEAGLKQILKTTFGDGYRLLNGSPRLKILAKAISVLSKNPEYRGEILIYIFEKPAINF